MIFTIITFFKTEIRSHISSRILNCYNVQSIHLFNFPPTLWISARDLWCLRKLIHRRGENILIHIMVFKYLFLVILNRK